MSEEYDETQDEQGTGLWDMLKLEDPGDPPDEYEDLERDADEDVAKADKMEKKLSAKMDDMQKKFERTIIRERIGKFEESASDLQKDLFKAIAVEVSDVESLDKAMNLVNERARKFQEEEERHKQMIDEQYKQQAAQNWGMGPMGTPTPRTKDEEEKLLEKISSGDSHALFQDLMEDNWPSV